MPLDSPRRRRRRSSSAPPARRRRLAPAPRSPSPLPVPGAVAAAPESSAAASSSDSESDRKRRKKEKKKEKKRKKKEKKKRKKRGRSSDSDREPATGSLWDAAPAGVDAEAARRRLAEQLAAQRQAFAEAKALPENQASVAAFAADLATRHQRELYIGSLPPESVNEDELRIFLNSAMAQAGLNERPGDSIVCCRVNGRFAFVEFRTIEECSAGLCLDGILLFGRGSGISVSRPKRHDGPMMPHENWLQTMAKRVQQHPELQGKVIGTADGTVPSPDACSGPGLADTQAALAPKVNRELFLGGLEEAGVTDSLLVDFVNNAMVSKGLIRPGSPPGLPCISARSSGHFAFVEFRDPYECSLAMNLCGIYLGNCQLVPKRPRAYTGPLTQAVTWQALESGHPAPPPEPLNQGPPPPIYGPQGNPDMPQSPAGAGAGQAAEAQGATLSGNMALLKGQWVAARRQGEAVLAERLSSVLMANGVAPEESWLSEAPPPPPTWTATFAPDASATAAPASQQQALPPMPSARGGY
eukprot:TRINITY_DN13199_c0_g1_i1.p1 TRINITY_DN13199_c0_g1~~TRINITY_DN13199_c0_g1_i1.p1  ORF type:complete len:563 (+),score=204.99 TRINITY_DN13199_c0_g1_i1:110-1690(+)